MSRPRNLDYNKKKSDLPPYPVMWVQTFSSGSDTIKQLIDKTNKVIKQSPVWKEEKSNVLGLVHRRAPNLGDTILQRKRLSLGVDTDGLWVQYDVHRCQCQALNVGKVDPAKLAH